MLNIDYSILLKSITKHYYEKKLINMCLKIVWHKNEFVSWDGATGTVMFIFTTAIVLTMTVQQTGPSGSLWR